MPSINDILMELAKTALETPVEKKAFQPGTPPDPNMVIAAAQGDPNAAAALSGAGMPPMDPTQPIDIQQLAGMGGAPAPMQPPAGTVPAAPAPIDPAIQQYIDQAIQAAGQGGGGGGSKGGKGAVEERLHGIEQLLHKVLGVLVGQGQLPMEEVLPQQQAQGDIGALGVAESTSPPKAKAAELEDIESGQALARLIYRLNRVK